MKTLIAAAAILIGVSAMVPQQAHAQAAGSAATSSSSSPDSKPSANDTKSKTAGAAEAGGGAK